MRRIRFFSTYKFFKSTKRYIYVYIYIYIYFFYYCFLFLIQFFKTQVFNIPPPPNNNCNFRLKNVLFYLQIIMQGAKKNFRRTNKLYAIQRKIRNHCLFIDVHMYNKHIFYYKPKKFSEKKLLFMFPCICI